MAGIWIGVKVPNWSEIQSKLVQAYRLLRDEGVPPDFPSVPGGDFPWGGEDVRGWVLIKPTVKYINSKPGDADYKSFTSFYGQVVLSTDGELYDVHGGWGYAEGRGSFNDTWLQGASKEKLVGKTGAPFSALDGALNRIIALYS